MVNRLVMVTIDGQVIKRAIHILCKPLCNILNTCFEKGVFPDTRKTSKVIIVHKSGPNDIFTNYRSILLLTCFAKMSWCKIIGIFR